MSCYHEPFFVSVGIMDEYDIDRMHKLILHPQYRGDNYEWYVDDSLVCVERDYIFCVPDTGVFHIRLNIVRGLSHFSHTTRVKVRQELTAYSPYISKVYEYCPAPGQFINTLPFIDSIDDETSVLLKVNKSLVGKETELVCLGSYGGYVTFGFDHSVCNVRHSYDFRIWGNAFASPSEKNGRLGGSCEPGIVMVSVDKNENGLPDDEWYELAGSEYYKSSTIHNYQITYYRPLSHNVSTHISNISAITDSFYILWKDNMGNNGFLSQVSYHRQDYYPLWITNDSITLSGTLLPQNAVDESGNGTSYMLYAYDWGYVDNAPNDSAILNSFDISWAVDLQGKPVNLPCIDFIRIYTGVNQQCGWIGETSTEVSKAEDLHVKDYTMK